MNPNDIFDSKYKIISVLGKGGMGTVYLAENIKLGTLWAIKEISKSPGGKGDLLIEPNILKKLNHPALPRIFDIIEDESCIYIIVDYIEGTPLSVELAKVGKFEEEKVVKWAKQICDVLLYLHSIKPNPIIYRDMKPSNIILTDRGTIKLIDFGIAREFKPESEDDTVYLGTRGYAAPEQYGLGQSNVKTDIYNLGITLYHLLTGKVTGEESIKITNTDSNKAFHSEKIESIIIKCTKKNPMERYQSIKELAADLDGIGKPDSLNQEVQGLKHETSMNMERNSRNIVSFKKLVLTVWGNAEFACELSYLTAKLTDFSVLLIDLDLLNPTVDLHLSLKNCRNEVGYEVGNVYNGLNKILKSGDRNIITEDLIVRESVKRMELKNLYILYGDSNLDDYRAFSEESLVKLLDKAYQSFDITVLIVNKSIFDSFTLISLEKSDFNIIPLRADLDVLREFERYTSFLNKKNHIKNEKTKFVAYEYDSNTNLNKDSLYGILGKNFIGFIRSSEKRRLYRNLKIPYARRMEKSILDDYIAVMSLFNIVPGISIMIKVNDWLFKRLRAVKSICKYIMRCSKIIFVRY